VKEKQIVTSLIGKEEEFRILELVRTLNVPLLLIGKPGVSKTSVVLDYFKSIQPQAQQEEIFILETDDSTPNSAVKGEMFLRVDQTPNKLFKFNGTKWIEVDKDRTDSYTYDRQYILFLIEKLKTGEYDIDQLSATEQELVAEEIKKQENDQT